MCKDLCYALFLRVCVDGGFDDPEKKIYVTIGLNVALTILSYLQSAPNNDTEMNKKNR